MTGPEREAEEARDADAATNRPGASTSPAVLRLAGEPPRVVRLSRKTLASIGGVVGLGIGGALVFAFQPRSDAPPDNLHSVESPNRAEQVTGAPATYDAAPAAFRTGSRAAVSAPMDETATSAQPLEPRSVAEPSRPDPSTAASQARDRAAQERDSARASQLFLGGQTGRRDDRDVSAPSGPDTSAPAAIASDTSSTAASRRGAFLEARGDRATQTSARIIAPASPYVLQAGSIIPAALITGIRSDLPGQITAQVTQNVYDSPTGQLLLIPQGSRLIGEYDSEVGAGQNRVLLAWDRLILPGGHSILLDRLPGADAAGMAGLQDRTNYHWGHMLKAALISTLLGAGSELVTDDDSDLIRALRHGTQDSVSQTGRQLVERQLSVPPTLTVRPGFALQVIVKRDIIFEPHGGAR
jgi:type IV secretion system protein VirB10